MFKRWTKRVTCSFFFLIIERLMDVQEMESLVLFFLFFIERLMDVQEIESLVQK